MTCQEMLDFLMDYLDGVLPADVRAAFDEHLGECPDCVAYLGSYQETIQMGKLCEREDHAVPEDLVQAILAARRLIQ